MKLNLTSSFVFGTFVLIAAAPAGRAQTVVYDNTTANAPANLAVDGYFPVWGAALNLSQGGRLSGIEVSLFNPSAGTILSGTTTINFYNNSTPYISGSLAAQDPFLGSVTLTSDFTGSGGVGPGGFAFLSQNNLVSLDIDLPQYLIVTEQFTQDSGTATGAGVVANNSASVGSGPSEVYVNQFGSLLSEGFYSFGSLIPETQIAVASGTPTPEPGVCELFSLGGLALFVFRRRLRTA